MSALPELEVPCPHCTPGHIQAEMLAERNAWVTEELAAYEEFVESYQGFEAHAAWKRTPAGRVLYEREPLPPDVGCVECDYTRVQLTDAGRELLAFVRRHVGGTR